VRPLTVYRGSSDCSMFLKILNAGRKGKLFTHARLDFLPRRWLPRTVPQAFKEANALLRANCAGKPRSRRRTSKVVSTYLDVFQRTHRGEILPYRCTVQIEADALFT
jgi:hypothetical protein